MNEIALRVRGIISALKPLAILVFILAAILLVVAISNFITVLRNPTEPQQVTVGQVVDSAIAPQQHVSVAGYAIYEEAYILEDETGDILATYFYLVDHRTGDIVVVKAETPDLYGRIEGQAIITGMTTSTPSDLKELIEEDATAIRADGYEINPALYIAEGETPPDLLGALLLLFISGSVTAVCLGMFLFPSIVFAPRPVQVTTDPVQGEAGVRASGKFLKLKQVRPNIVVGKRTRKFSNAVANLISQGNDRLLVYIHHVMRTYVYGIPVGKQESDWGIFLQHATVTRIESGILYRWKKKHAVRIQHVQKGKPQTLIVSFEQPWGQSLFVRKLQLQGFTVSNSGE